MQQHKSKLFAGIIFIIVSLILNISYSSLVNISVDEMKNRYQYVINNESNLIKSHIDKVVVRTYTIREMIYEKDGKIDFFDKVAPFVYQSVKEDTGVTLRNIAVAPGGKVSVVYPLAHNESLVGFDFTDLNMSGNKEAMEAYLNAQTVITNPFPLVQGGIGMAARTPVFIKRNGNQEFWGLVTGTMDFGDLVKVTGIENLDNLGLKYCLWYADETGNKTVLACSGYDMSNKRDAEKQSAAINKLLDEMTDCIEEEFSVYNLRWHLEVMPVDGWYNKNILVLARAGLFIMSVLITCVIIMFFRIRHDGNVMKTLAEQDGLTQTFSRYYLNSTVLDINTGDWKNKKNNLSVAIVDVDKFKQINDNFGHAVGDRALIAISQVLKKTPGNGIESFVIRYGGDEFLMFFKNADKKELKIIFQNILAQIENIKFLDVPELSLSVSIGSCCHETCGDISYTQMMKIADENLYKVKEAGRNNYSVD